MEDAESGLAPNRGDQHRRDGSEICYPCLFDHLPDPLVILDVHGQVIVSNRKAEELLSQKPGGISTLLAEHFSREASAETGTEESPLFGGVQEVGAVRWQFELPGTDRILEAGLSFLPGEVLEGTGFLWTAHDLMDRAQLDETRQELVNMLVHDLRVPLSNIQNSLDLVLTAWRERDVSLPIDQVLQIGQRSAQRMEQLISDILDSARLQAHERALTVTSIDVESLVEEAVDTIAGSAQRRNQTVRVRVKPNLPLMEGDLELLRRVLVNLLGNAVKYTDEYGEVTLTATLSDSDSGPDTDQPATYFRFTVEDNGPGIAPRVQERLFRLFYRGDSTLIKSAGIGLAFCKLAVEAHGGRIWVESTLGRGSTFSFTVPQPLPKHAAYYQESN